MRTTVEITDAQRARLLEIAAAKGQKGFSSLVQEAIDLLLEREDRRAERVQAALAVKGSLAAKDADELSRRAAESRKAWR